MKILLGICASISAYKAPWIVRELQRAGAQVRVVMTPDATRFVTPLVLQNLCQHPVIVDPFQLEQQEQGSWHVHWARWADRALVAPCSANTLARLAHGLADNALSLLLLSRPPELPLLLAPAMDPDMWLQPSTRRNLRRLQQDGARILPPEEGELASGLIGPGRLPEPATIAGWALSDLDPQGQSLEGCRVLITAGPTREAIDAVRFISNHSSGKMGYALAAEAQARGAQVVLVSGPVSLAPPAGVELLAVESAQEMLTACQQHSARAHIVIKAAAVADFAPAQVTEHKLKKEALGQDWSLAMRRNPDILHWLGSHKPPGQLLVGFALETDNLEANARRKLEGKNCDLIVLNQAGVSDSGFGGDRNTLWLVDPEGSRALPPMSKRDCAGRIWDHLQELWLKDRTGPDASR